MCADQLDALHVGAHTVAQYSREGKELNQLFHLHHVLPVALGHVRHAAA